MLLIDGEIVLLPELVQVGVAREEVLAQVVPRRDGSAGFFVGIRPFQIVASGETRKQVYADVRDAAFLENSGHFP